MRAKAASPDEFSPLALPIALWPRFASQNPIVRISPPSTRTFRRETDSQTPATADAKNGNQSIVRLTGLAPGQAQTFG